MRFDLWCIPSNPEAHVKSCLISVAFILRPEDVAEWNSPIFIYVPLPVINFRIGSGDQNHFRRTVEERRVGPLQFVSKPNSKGDGSRIGHLLARRDIIAATSYVPRVTLAVSLVSQSKLTQGFPASVNSTESLLPLAMGPLTLYSISGTQPRFSYPPTSRPF